MTLARIGSTLAGVALLAACQTTTSSAPAQQAAAQQPTAQANEPSAEFKAAYANASDDEKRQALATVIVSQCILQDLQGQSFRATAAQSKGWESMGTGNEGEDIYIDRPARVLMRLTDDMCHVLFAGSDVPGTASLAHSAVKFGTNGVPDYQINERGEYFTNFTRTDGQSFVSVVRRDKTPGAEDPNAVSIYLVRRKG